MVTYSLIRSLNRHFGNNFLLWYIVRNVFNFIIFLWSKLFIHYSDTFVLHQFCLQTEARCVTFWIVASLLPSLREWRWVTWGRNSWLYLHMIYIVIDRAIKWICQKFNNKFPLKILGAKGKLITSLFINLLSHLFSFYLVKYFFFFIII